MDVRNSRKMRSEAGVDRKIRRMFDVGSESLQER